VPNARIAKALLDDLIEVNQEFWPVLYKEQETREGVLV
jgi:maltose-6'-phosphate glucosidase